ncbi:MAG: cyclic nucleotide-binding protein, partial [Spirochaetota bacterium]
MSLVGIINSDTAIETRIRNEFQKWNCDTMSLHFAYSADSIREVINFDLPEIVILNLTDLNLDFNTIFEQISADIWLHTFGIVALFDKNKIDEDQAAEKLKNLNALAFIEYQRIEALLIKYIRIIDSNQQLIFQYDLADKLSGLITGSFVMDNDISSIPVYTALALTALFQHGFINSEKKINLQLVLQELLINAVEHGNCAISFSEKSEYLNAGGNITDLVNAKCMDPAVASKKITFEWEIRPDKT